jgi:hypothetical protein
VTVTRRLAGINRPPVGGLAGPLKILAAVALPDTPIPEELADQRDHHASGLSKTNSMIS